jgi:Skp family chaperone for outer membrane proteins
MRITIVTLCIGTVTLALLLTVGGCVSEPSPPHADTRRIEALEKEVNALRNEAASRDEALRKELSLIRESLDTMSALVKQHKAPAAAKKDDEKLEEAIDTKAKTFVNDSLDRLLDITRKLLDKMNKELNDSMTTDPPAPEGDHI